jgi:hypothetical protein
MANRPRKHVRSNITDAEALEFLENLATEGHELRDRLQANPRDVLLEYRIDVSAESVPSTITLPRADDVRAFINETMSGERRYSVLSYAILYFVLGSPSNGNDY